MRMRGKPVIRRLTGSALYWLCTALDCVPWHDQHWYRYGQRGCAWGVSHLAGKVYGE